MNLLSTLIGIAALLAALIGLVPLLGWLNWFVIPVVAVGLVLGLLSNKTSGAEHQSRRTRNRRVPPLHGRPSLLEQSRSGLSPFRELLWLAVIS